MKKTKKQLQEEKDAEEEAERQAAAAAAEKTRQQENQDFEKELIKNAAIKLQSTVSMFIQRSRLLR